MESIIREKVRQHIVNTVLGGDPRGLEDDTDLTEGGLLDSFAIVQLLLYIEEQFAIEIPRDRITRANLSTIAAIARLIVGCLPGALPTASPARRGAEHSSSDLDEA